MLLNDFKLYSSYKKKYLTLQREPFFELASQYIESDTHVILDIGCGEGDFFVFLKDRGVDPGKIYLLDGNEATVEQNKSLTPHSLNYLVPDKLPFDDGSVDLIHVSHLIDNLGVSDLYSFLLDMDRVLKPGGVLVISTPVLWADFYNDLSHTRPYNPYVFFKYFVYQGRHSRFGKISDGYSIAQLVYRYFELPLDEGWSSTVPFIDLLFITTRRVLRQLGIKRLAKNGYTLVLKKGHESAV